MDRALRRSLELAEGAENEADEDLPPDDGQELQTLFHVLPADIAAAVSVSDGPGIRKRSAYCPPSMAGSTLTAALSPPERFQLGREG
jgi:hypothetical protein